MNDSTLFAFENDFVERLQCVPMAVRFKLDRVGVKITLRQWSQFEVETRRELLLAACESSFEIGLYRERLVELLAALGDAVRPLPEGSLVPWQANDATPVAVRSFASSVGVEPPSATQWRALTPLKRFVLLKLSRDNHDNVNFVPALREFDLYRKAGSPEASYVASA